MRIWVKKSTFGIALHPILRNVTTKQYEIKRSKEKFGKEIRKLYKKYPNFKMHQQFAFVSDYRLNQLGGVVARRGIYNQDLSMRIIEASEEELKYIQDIAKEEESKRTYQQVVYVEDFDDKRNEPLNKIII